MGLSKSVGKDAILLFNEQQYEIKKASRSVLQNGLQ